MASAEAAINVIVNGASKIDRIIDKVNQLDSIVQNLNKTPLDISVKKATSELDSFETELKALQATIKNSEKAVDGASSSIDGYIDQITAAQAKLNQLNPNTKAYNQVLERQKKAIDGLAKSQKDLANAQQILDSSQSKLGGASRSVEQARTAKRAAEAINTLADEYLKLGRAQEKGVSGQILKNQLAPTLAQLGAQADALKLVASNSRAASSEFNRFTIASQAVGQRIFETRQKQLSAVAFGLSASAPKVNVGTKGEGSIAGARDLVSSLVSSYGQIVKSEAALSAYAEQLRSIQSLVPYASNEFRVLEEAIAGVNTEMSGIGLRGQKSSIQSLSGPATDLGSLKAFKQKESYQKRVNEELTRQADIESRINNANLGDSQKLELRNRLEEAATALANNQLAIAKKITNEIDRQRMSMERVGRVQKVGDAFRAGGPGNVTARLNAPQRVQAQISSAQLLGERLRGLELQGVDTSAQTSSLPLGPKVTLQRVLNTLKASELDISDRLLSDQDILLNGVREQIKLERQRIVNQKMLESSPNSDKIGGFRRSYETFAGSLASSGDFFGKLSPEQAISKVVAQFNQSAGSKSGGAGGNAGGAARNVVDTFAKSLQSGTGKLVSATTSVFSQVTKAINSAFGIASPSRFMLEVVRNLAATYASELERQYPRIKSATEQAFGERGVVGNVKKLQANNRGFGFVSQPALAGYQPLASRSFEPSGQGGEHDAMMRDFKYKIAALTTQPKVFANLLNAIPSSALTTDLIGAANRRASAVENIPNFLQTERQIGIFGELEKEITSLYASVKRGIDIPNPWVAATADYKDFVLEISRGTEKLNRQQFTLPDLWANGFSNFNDIVVKRARELSGVAALPPSPTRLALPAGPDQSSVVEQRIRQAYQRSAQRGAQVLADDLEAALRRVVGSALPPGGGSIPPVPPTGVGAGGAAGGGAIPPGGNRQGDPRGLFTLPDLQNPARASTNSLMALQQTLNEIRNSLDRTIPGFERLDNELREVQGTLGRELERRDPNATFLTRQFGPRTARGLSEGLIGGAFPLLFGQGMGAAAGGGLGGLAGGFAGGGLGFGLSLVGTALGTAFDTAVQSAKDLGAALNDVSTVFDKVKERSLFSSRETEKYAAKLQEAGLVASASALAQKEIIDKIGVSGVERLRMLEDSSDKLGRAWGELNLQLQEALSGPMAQLLTWVTQIVTEINKSGRSEAQIDAIRSNLPQAGRDRLDRTNVAGNPLLDLFGFVAGIDVPKPGAFPGDNPFASKEQRAKQLASLYGVGTSQAGVASKPEQVRDQAVAQAKTLADAFSTQLETIDIGKKLTDQLRDTARQQEDLNQQAFDTRKQYEEAIADIRLNIERTVQRQALDNLQQQNRLYEIQGEIRLQQIKNITAASVLEGSGNEDYQQILQIVGEAAELELSTQQEVEKRKRNLEAELQSRAIETELFKADIAKQVAKLSEDSQKRIAEINKGVRRANEQYDLQRFRIEKTIADLKLKQVEAEIQFNKDSTEAQLTQAQRDSSGNPKLITYFQNLLEVYEAQNQALQKSKQILSSVVAPAKLQEVGGLSTQSVSTAGYDKVREEGNRLLSVYAQMEDVLTGLVKSGQWTELQSRLADFADKGLKAASQDLDNAIATFVSKGDLLAGAMLMVAEAKKKLLDPNNEVFLEIAKIPGAPVEEIRQLAIAYTDLAAVQQKGAATNQFYADLLSENNSEIQSLREEINATLVGTRAFDQAMAQMAAAGLTEADEAFKAVLESATELDRLRDKAANLKVVQEAATELTGSLRGLIETFYETGSASDAIKKFGEQTSKAGMKIGLDIIFKPVEEAMLKGLTDGLQKFFPGLDLRPEAVQQLATLKSVNIGISTISQQITALMAGLRISDPTVKAAATAATVATTAAVAPASPNPYAGIKYAPGGYEATNRSADSYAEIGKTVGSFYTPAQLAAKSALPGAATPSTIQRLPVDTFTGTQVQQELQGATQGLAALGQQSQAVATTTQESVKKLTPATAEWQKSLGGVVTGIGLASSAVIGIMGGMQQIKEGGAGNVLSGIGSILTTIGGIGLSVAGMMKPAAKGAYFEGGTSYFAKGGIVTSPTLFKFADGGQLKKGVMGEAGPEAVMPLKRGSDGKLGVAQVSDGGGNPNRMHEVMGRAPGQRQSVDFNIKFETTKINGVEYVSKDQLDSAMAETRRYSVNEGAKRGMGMTLDRLQQSPSTRNRLGMR